MKQKIIFLVLLLATMMLSCSDKDGNNTYAIAVDKTTLTFENSLVTESQTFNIVSEGAWKIELKDGAWIAVNKTEGAGNAEITVNSQPNESGVEREDTLTIVSPSKDAKRVEITIKQTYTDHNINVLDYVVDEAFKAYLIEKIFNGKTNVTRADVAKVTIIDCSRTSYNGNMIMSLKGIEFFTALTTLSCDENSLSSLDISKNIALMHLVCYNNSLSSLDVSKNTKLMTLVCSSNPLSSLDVSKNAKLMTLACSDNSLSTLDISTNTALTYLDCYENSLSALDVSKNTVLESLSCNGNPLSTLDVSKNTKLIYLGCYYNSLSSLDVSKNTALTHLECSSNSLSSLGVSKNIVLESLDCSGNSLSTLDVSKNTKLTNLDCSNNRFTAGSVKILKKMRDAFSYIGPNSNDPIYNWID